MKLAKLLSAFLLIACSAALAGDDLESSFTAPPDDAKPQTWFHVMSSNMSKEGITKDLEAIAEAGIGGTQLFHVTQAIPLGDVIFASEEHFDMIQHMAAESARLGLKFSLHNTDGWTASGGPWVKPEHSMKKVVYSQAIVEGGEISLQLEQPLTYRDFYRDIAVLAYPALPQELIERDMPRPVVTASGREFDATLATDGSVEAITRIEPEKGEEDSWILMEFEEPVTPRFIEMHFSGRGREFTLEHSDDGKHFEKVSSFRPLWSGKDIQSVNAALDPVTARFFRLQAKGGFRLREIELFAAARIDNYIARSIQGHTTFEKLKPIVVGDADVIDPNAMRDLTADLGEDGKLETTLPDGRWSILRFGYTTTNEVNVPSSDAGKGLEVDKFSREALEVHYEAFTKRVVDDANAVAPNILSSALIDSYEVGGQNWTEGLAAMFEERFGYSIVPYLPLFVGKYVGEPKDMEAVLWDFRSLTTDLMRDNYFKAFQELAAEDGLKTYAEAYGNGPFNELDAFGVVDVPMGEFWLTRNSRVASAASAAHIYNKPIISAEAFTAQKHIHWNFHPGMAKPVGDKIWSLGVNEFFFHRFAHQANVHVMPGMTMSRWGAHIDRTQTWWKSAGKAWFKYIARGQSMLRQGTPVIDVLLFVGDGAPRRLGEKRNKTSLIPHHINFDFVNPDVLVNRVSVEDGRLILPHGAKYKAIVLENSEVMAPKTLEALEAIANAGGIIVGKPPELIAGRMLSEQQQKGYQRAIDTIWSKPTTYREADWDRIYSENDLRYDMTVQGSPRTIYTHRRTEDADIYFFASLDDARKVHEVTFDVSGKVPELWYPMDGSMERLGQFSETEDGRTVAPIDLEAGESVFVIFREDSSGKPHLPYFSENKNHQLLLDSDDKLTLRAFENGSHEIKRSKSQSKSVAIKGLPADRAIDGSWSVAFDPFYGYGETVQFDALVDWKDHSLPQIRDYSGNAVYRKTVTLDPQWLASGQSVVLDLGAVSIAADVAVNGHDFGTVWTAPFKVDITEALKEGENSLEITVYNLWVNRLIGDESLKDTSGYKKANAYYGPTNPMVDWYKKNIPPPESDRITFTTYPFFTKDSERVSSGLLGPVTLSASQTVVVE